MPPRHATSIEERARSEISLEIERMIDALVASEGPAADADPVSAARQLQQWGQRDPKIGDPDQLQQDLMRTGLQQFPDLLDPKSPQALAVVKAHPQIAEMYAQPCDEDLADMLTRLAEFPLRLGILEPYQDDPEEMCRLAESLDRRWQNEIDKRRGATSEPSQDATGSAAPPDGTWGRQGPDTALAPPPPSTPLVSAAPAPPVMGG